MASTKRAYSVWKLLCFATFVFYTYDVCELYFARTTVTNIEFSSQRQLPAISWVVDGVQPADLVRLQNVETLQLLNYSHYVYIDSYGSTVYKFHLESVVSAIKFRFNSSFEGDYVIGAHSRDVFFSQSSVKLIAQISSSTSYFPFSRRFIKRLPLPFTNCVYYPKPREELIRICSQNMSTRTDHCMLNYPYQECEQEIIYTTPGEFRLSSAKFRKCIIVFEEDRGLNILMSPAIYEEILIINLAGLSGAWLGLSFLEVAKLGKFIGKIVKKCVTVSKYSRRSLSFLNKKIVKCVCLVLCTHQVIEVCISYLDYTTTTELTINTPSDLKIPAYTFCFNWLKLFGEKNLSIPTFFTFAHVHNNTKMKGLNDAYFFNHEYGHIQQVYYHGYYKCVKYIMTQAVHGIENSLTRRTARVSFIMITPNVKNGFYFMLQNECEYHTPTDRQHTKVPMRYFKMIGDYSFSAGLLIFTQKRFAYPYSNCLNYAMRNSSRRLCYETCITRYAGARRHVEAPYNVNVLPLSDFLLDVSSTAADECSKLCKPACHLTSYFISGFNWQPIKHSSIASARLETTSTLTPRMTLTECIIYLACSVNFWLLLSVMDILKLLLRGLKRISKNRRYLQLAKSRLRLCITVAFLYQIAIVVQNYCNYFVVTDTKLSSDIVPLQKFSICFNQLHIMRRGVDTYYLKGSVPYSPKEAIDNTLTFSEIFNVINFNRQIYNKSVIYRFEYIFVKTYLLNPYFKCFLISSDKKFKKYVNSNDTNREHNHAFIATSKLSLPIFLNLGSNYLSTGANVQILNGKYKLWSSVYRTRSLPHPYTSNCFDYTKINIRDKDYCISSCQITNAYKKYTSKLLYVPTIDINDSVRYNWRSDISFRDLHLCFKQCSRQDCYSESHVFDSTSGVNRKQPSNIALAPITLDVYVTLTPKMNFSQFVLLLPGVTGLWLGLDMIRVYWHVVKLFKGLRKIRNACRAC